MKEMIFKAKKKYLIFVLLFMSISCSETGQQKYAGDDADVESGSDVALNAALPDIIGTSWNLIKIYARGQESKGDLFVFPEYLFCKSGRWEAHTDSNGMGQMGTFTVDGDKLILVHDGADQLTARYTITWNEAGKYLELDDGELVFRLRFKIKAGC
jgi:hypothetical protein